MYILLNDGRYLVNLDKNQLAQLNIVVFPLMLLLAKISLIYQHSKGVKDQLLSLYEHAQGPTLFFARQWRNVND